MVTPTPIWAAARAGEYLLAPSLDDRRGCPADEARRRFAGVFRCVLANPYRPAAFDPRWRTAVGVAAAIDAEGAFDRLPILPTRWRRPGATTRTYWPTAATAARTTAAVAPWMSC